MLLLWSSKFKKNSLNYWTVIITVYIIIKKVLYNLVYRNNHNIFTYTLVILMGVYLFVRFNG